MKYQSIRCLSMALLITIFPLMVGAADKEKAVRMQPWSLEDVQAALSASPSYHPFPTSNERDFWQQVIQDPRLRESLQGTLEQARSLAKEPLPPLPASLYLDFQRTGNRTRYQSPQGARTRFLSAFALAECLENQGEFLDPLMDTLWAFCEESDWCMPAHTPGLVDLDKMPIDLRASAIASQIALVNYELGDRLLPAVRKRIREEMDRRIFNPYLQRDDFWWLTGTNNWNAVCNGNVVCAALLMVEDRERLARIVTKAQNAMIHFLDGFGEDGGTGEGLGYWNYGFGNYVQAADQLHLYTEGKLDLFAPPLIRKIAAFPLQTELSPNHYPSFSDGGENNRFSTGLLCMLADRLQEPALRRFALSHRPDAFSTGSLESLFETLPALALTAEKKPFVPESYVFLNGIGWMISHVNPSEPNGLVLAALAGSNNESHNHNDVGNFIIHFQGESILTDIGAPEYDRDFFSSKRYEYLSARSLGHSVPMVNHCEQRAGQGTEALQVKSTHSRSEDTLRAEISLAYPPEAQLESLVRTIRLKRSGRDGWVEIQDAFRLKQEGLPIESAFITFGEVEIQPGGKVRVKANNADVEIQYDAKQLDAEVQEFDSHEAHLHVADRYPTVRRIVLKSKDSSRAQEIRVKIVPLKK